MDDIRVLLASQELTVANEWHTVTLRFEHFYAVEKTLTTAQYDKVFGEMENSDKYGSLAINTTSKNGVSKSCLFTGVGGGVWLHTAGSGYGEDCYSVKISDHFLVCSIGSTFMSFDLEKQEINWAITPDEVEIFEFYDLEDDYLVRGEMTIHRIDCQGNVKWSFHGHDIWVNINGLPEVQIVEDKIILTNFNTEIFIIDFDGNTIDLPPKSQALNNSKPNLKPWWKFW